MKRGLDAQIKRAALICPDGLISIAVTCIDVRQVLISARDRIRDYITLNANT